MDGERALTAAVFSRTITHTYDPAINKVKNVIFILK